MNKINWKIRFKNPAFLVQTIGSIIVPIITYIFGYYGISFQDLTTWTGLLDLILKAVSNPFVVFTSLFMLFNAITDPTTRGVSDSDRALTYRKPQ